MNFLFHILGRLYFFLKGYTIENNWPKDVKKAMVAIIPHTSNWDFLFGVLSRQLIGRDIKFVGKKELFKPPFGFFFKMMGGYPVDRSKRTNFVDAVVDIYNSKEEFYIGIAPEGTRKKVKELKSGFYYIAKGANIPIIVATIDAGNKKLVFSKPFYPTDDKEKDFEWLKNYCSQFQAINPETSWP